MDYCVRPSTLEEKYRLFNSERPYHSRIFYEVALLSYLGLDMTAELNWLRGSGFVLKSAQE